MQPGMDPECGTLVALEGDPEQISTQLQLLPPSSKILILPPIEQELQLSANEDGSFDPRKYIQAVHTAYTSRSETARSFLQHSTAEQPRLAFLNGGCVRARTTCLTKICDQVTGGDLDEAEKLFRDIVKDGVAGLMRGTRDVENKHATFGDQDSTAENQDDNLTWSSSHFEANRDSMVADTNSGSYDSTTSQESSSPSTPVDKSADEDMNRMPAIANEHRGSWPLKSRLMDQQPYDEANLDDSSVEVTVRVPSDPFADFPPPPKVGEVLEIGNRGNVIKKTVIKIPTRNLSIQERRRNVSAPRPPTPHTNLQMKDPWIRDQVDESNKTTLFSPSDNHSAPPTPGMVEYGEACLVDVQALKRLKTLRRIKSVDRIYLSDPEAQPRPREPKSRKRATSVGAIERQSSESEKDLANGSGSFDAQPRTDYLRASQTTIRRTPTLVRLSSSSSRMFVDRGTNPGQYMSPVTSNVNHQGEVKTETESYRAVFDILEDLIIYLSDVKNKAIFDHVIESYKNGTYPVVSTGKNPAKPKIPQRESAHRFASDHDFDADDEGHSAGEDAADPFNPDTYPTKVYRSFPLRSPATENPSSRTVNPPMSAIGSPNPIQAPFCPALKFRQLSPTKEVTVAEIQNSLRTLLSEQFPSEKNYSQYAFPVDNDRLWKPMFNNDEKNSSSTTVDMILALGCEDGVEKALFDEISVQIEKFGTKRNGSSRTGKLDMKYLITNAMQTFTSRPLASQTQSNPFSDAQLLATLILPHLESYLSTNEHVRFLVLFYSASHLSTVLAIRKLLGADLFKVAGIIDSLSSDPPSRAPKRRSKSPTSLHALSHSNNERLLTSRQRLEAIKRQVMLAQSRMASYGSAASPSSSPKLHQHLPSFARANFVLPSAATDHEISSFLSAIWRCLIEKSEFYVPEPIPSKSQTSMKSRPSSSRAREHRDLYDDEPQRKPPTPASARTMDLEYHKAVIAGQSREQQQHQRPPKMRLVNGVARDSGFPKGPKALSTRTLAGTGYSGMGSESAYNAVQPVTSTSVRREQPQQHHHSHSHSHDHAHAHAHSHSHTHAHTHSQSQQSDRKSIKSTRTGATIVSRYSNTTRDRDRDREEECEQATTYLVPLTFEATPYPPTPLEEPALDLDDLEPGSNDINNDNDDDLSESESEPDIWERKFIPRWVSSGSIATVGSMSAKKKGALMGMGTPSVVGVRGAGVGSGGVSGRRGDASNGSGGGSRKALRWLGLA